MTEGKKTSERERSLKNIYVPRKYDWILKKVSELAEEEGRSFSNMVIRLLLEALKARGKA